MSKVFCAVAIVKDSQGPYVTWSEVLVVPISVNHQLSSINGLWPVQRFATHIAFGKARLVQPNELRSAPRFIASRMLERVSPSLSLMQQQTYPEWCQLEDIARHVYGNGWPMPTFPHTDRCVGRRHTILALTSS